MTENQDIRNWLRDTGRCNRPRPAQPVKAGACGARGRAGLPERARSTAIARGAAPSRPDAARDGSGRAGVWAACAARAAVTRRLYLHVVEEVPASLLLLTRLLRQAHEETVSVDIEVPRAVPGVRVLLERLGFAMTETTESGWQMRG